MKKRHSPEQIVRKLRQADEKLASGISVPEVARELGVSEATYHRWRNRYGGMNPSETKRLKELEKENARLKKARRRSSPGPPDPKGGEQKKLLSPARRRKASEHVQSKLSISERRACRVLGQPRSTQRYARRKGKKERILKERMVVLSRENPRYG